MNKNISNAIKRIVFLEIALANWKNIMKIKKFLIIVKLEIYRLIYNKKKNRLRNFAGVSKKK